jgi:hypothetical protein
MAAAADYLDNDAVIVEYLTSTATISCRLVIRCELESLEQSASIGTGDAILLKAVPATAPVRCAQGTGSNPRLRAHALEPFGR